MKIAQVPRRFVRSHWGGTETVILETCKRLLKMGHQTEIICPNALATSNQEVIEGVRVERTPYFYPYLGLSAEARALFDRKGGNLFSFSLLRALRKMPELDLIHLHTAKRVGGIGRHVAQKRRIPYIVSLHGGLFDVPAAEAQSWTAPAEGSYEWGKLLGWWVGSRRVLDDAAAIICVGEEERAQTQRHYPHKKVLHLPNGVDPERFAKGDGDAFRSQHGIPHNAFVVLTVGRIDPQKNQLLLLNALPQLSSIHSAVHGLIIGPVTNQPYHEKLLAEIKDQGIADRITLIAGLDASSQALVDAYHAADVFLLPSIHEPFGIVILEAWAAGLPVVASKVGGVPSFVVSGEDALLFDVQDAKGLLDAFQTLVETPEVGARIARNGWQKARNEYSWDRVTERLVQIYEEAIGENPLR